LSPSDPAVPLNDLKPLTFSNHVHSIGPTSIMPPPRIKCKVIRLVYATATDHWRPQSEKSTPVAVPFVARGRPRIGGPLPGVTKG
jgi:hypothetical protein